MRCKIKPLPFPEQIFNYFFIINIKILLHKFWIPEYNKQKKATIIP